MPFVTICPAPTRYNKAIRKTGDTPDTTGLTSSIDSWLSNHRASCYSSCVKTLQIELPDQVALEVDNAIRTGRFENASDVVRTALVEFIGQHRFELMEQQQLEDIAWAVREKPPGQ